MITSINQTKVVIIGAGVSGLLLAAQLLRLGITPLIIDKRNARDERNQHMPASAWSMEILAQLGLDKSSLEPFSIEGLTLQKRRLVLGELKFQASENSPFNPLQIIKQSVIERLLIQYLTQHACPIYWDITLTHWETSGEAYRLHLDFQGKPHQIQTAWMVASGSDVPGKPMHSAARETPTYPNFRGEVLLHESINRHVHIFLAALGNIQLLPLDGKGLYHITGILSKEALKEAHTNIKAVIRAIVGFDLPFKKVIWWSPEGQKQDKPVRNIDHRLICMGTTAGREDQLIWGGSINTAIQDTHNLAWKLAYVIQGKMPASALYTYPEERYAAEQMMHRQRALPYLLSIRTYPFKLLSNRILKSFITRLQHNKPLYDRWVARLGQTHMHYRNSKLSIHLSSGRQLGAGDRLPNLPVYHEKEKKQTTLHQWCTKPGFILLLLGEVPEQQLFAIAQWITQKYSPYIHLFYLPFSTRNQSIFDAFSIGHKRRKMLLIRPDMHIACVHDEVNTGLVDTYMREILRWEADSL